MNQLVQLEWRMQNYTQSHLLFKKKKSLQLFSSLNTLPLTLHSNQILLSTIRNKQQQFHSNYLKETNYFFKKCTLFISHHLGQQVKSKLISQHICLKLYMINKHKLF